MVKISPQGTILSSINHTFMLYLCHKSHKAEPGNESGWGCGYHANVFVIPVCPCLTPLAVTPVTPIILGCDISRAGAVFALVGTVPQGWSVDRGLQAYVMYNKVKLPKAGLILPHSDKWAIPRASLLFFCLQCEALEMCQSDQIKKKSLPLFPEQVSPILVAANNCNCSSFHFPHQ